AERMEDAGEGMGACGRGRQGEKTERRGMMGRGGEEGVGSGGEGLCAIIITIIVTTTLITCQHVQSVLRVGWNQTTQRHLLPPIHPLFLHPANLAASRAALPAVLRTGTSDSTVGPAAGGFPRKESCRLYSRISFCGIVSARGIETASGNTTARTPLVAAASADPPVILLLTLPARSGAP
ncbi:unnamed protein product, partial [Closterium sp. NIES-54]